MYTCPNFVSLSGWIRTGWNELVLVQECLLLFHYPREMKRDFEMTESHDSGKKTEK
jgi:hypothetical protein